MRDEVLEAPDEEGAEAMVLMADFAFSLKAAAVWSPLVGGFTARTIAELQSEFADEKNHRGCVSLTFKPSHG